MAKKRELDPLIPISEMKRLMTALVAVPKAKAKPTKSKPKKRGGGR